jgi:hypothetical protein
MTYLNTEVLKAEFEVEKEGKQKAEESNASLSSQIKETTIQLDSFKEQAENEARSRRSAEEAKESLLQTNTTLLQEHGEMKTSLDKLRLQKEDQAVKFSNELELLRTNIMSLVLEVKMKVNENVG